MKDSQLVPRERLEGGKYIKADNERFSTPSRHAVAKL